MSVADAAMQQRLDQVRPLIDAAFAGMENELARLDLAEALEGMRIDTAAFSLNADPADGRLSLVGVWKDGHGHLVGSIVVHADNSFFAEYCMAAAHPQKPGWFIDAVTAWGRDGVVKSEPRLLPVL